MQTERLTRALEIYHSTSADAFEQIQPLIGELRSRVLSILRHAGDHGATLDEIEVSSGLKHQTLCPRMRELAAHGFIVDSGRRRFTRAERKAIVWIPRPKDWTGPGRPGRITAAVERERIAAYAEPYFPELVAEIRAGKHWL